MTRPRAPGLLSLETARDAVLAVAEPVGTERVAAADAFGRITAETVTASVSLPPWANSAMDGYAIRSADTAGATEDAPVELRVIGDVAAGAAAWCHGRARHGGPDRHRGASPEGADAVVPVEDTTPLDAAGGPGPRGRDATGPVPAACLVHVAAGPGDSVRAAGSDLGAGQAILAPGRAIGAAAVTLIAGTGRADARWSIAGRGSRSSPPATRSGRRASRSARPGSPTPTARACVRTSPPPVATRSTSGSPSTTSTTSSGDSGAVWRRARTP